MGRVKVRRRWPAAWASAALEGASSVRLAAEERVASSIK